jgi:hypothetical protein
MNRAVEDAFLNSTHRLIRTNRNARTMIKKINETDLDNISESRKERLEYYLEKTTLDLKMAVKNHYFLSERLIESNSN